jgi:hypothetical protein
MSKTIVNQTLPLIMGEIEETLETFPHHPHQQLFANPDMRQDLLAYVLTRIQSNYIAVEEISYHKVKATSQRPSDELKSHMDDLIRQGIHEILERGQDILEHRIPGVGDPGLQASHWFG